MEEIYQKIWELAKTYYQQGRTYDIPQIEWMTKQADRIAETENLDKKLLLPLVILHDVGYSVVGQKNPHIKDKETKIIHMKEGAKIAEGVLKEIGYDQKLAEKIVYCISVHDNWVLGDDKPFQESEEMALFNDLDFLWPTSDLEAFSITAQSMDLSPDEFYEFWQKDEKLTRRPFCCPATNQMHKESMAKIKKLLDKEKEDEKDPLDS